MHGGSLCGWSGSRDGVRVVGGEGLGKGGEWCEDGQAEVFVYDAFRHIL